MAELGAGVNAGQGLEGVAEGGPEKEGEMEELPSRSYYVHDLPTSLVTNESLISEHLPQT